MSTAELIQITGILLEVVFIPILVWLGRTLVRLHVDVQGLLKGFNTLQVRMDKFDTYENRITRLEIKEEQREAHHS